MNLIRLCIERPVGVCVGVLLVCLFGFLAAYSLPVQLTPTVDVPIVTVTTRWPGANPAEVEREIIDRQEEQLRSVKNLRKMSSNSRDHGGDIVLEFFANTDKYAAAQDVNDKLRQVEGYPIEVEQPTVQSGDTEMGNTIAWLLLRSSVDSEETRKLRDFAKDHIQPYLDRVKGVASTDIYGGFEREVQVDVDAGKLAARGIEFRAVEQALRRQNENISGGQRTQGKRDFSLRTVGQYQQIDEILTTVVADTPGGPVYVRDVAEVTNGFKRAEGLVRSKGQFVLAFPVRRETGANVIEVMDELKAAIRRVNDEVLKARDMDLELVQSYDETVYIRQSIDMVQSNIVYGSALVLGLLLAFLRSWRATAVLALTIPVSVIGTFLIVFLMGRTLNVISLAGIAFAVGDVVDSAYVVLENIFRHRQMGKAIRQAVLDGTNEVWGAVLASTLTTMAVFIPVIFMQEEAGQLFRDISIAEVTAVGLSMIVAITVIPPLAARLLGASNRPRFVDDAQRPQPETIRDPVLRLAGWIAGVVAWINAKHLRQGATIAGLTIGSLFFASFLIPDTTYLPAGNRNLVFGFLLTPPGYNVAEYERMATVIEGSIAPYWELEEGSAEHAALDAAWTQQVEQMIAANQIPDLTNEKLSALERDRARREWLRPPPLIENFFFVSFNGGCFMGATSRDHARVKPLVRLLQTAGMQIPGIFPVFFQTQLFSFGGGNNAEVQIRGDDLDKVTQAASALMMACAGPFGFPRSEPRNFNLGRPEVRYQASQERAAELGLTTADIGFVVEACGDGVYVGDFHPAGGDTIDIALRVAGATERPTGEIANTPIYTPSGRVVALSAVCDISETTALEQIAHIERQRAVTLEITPPESLALEAVIRQIRDQIVPDLRKSGAIDPAVTVNLSGNADKLVEARNALVGEWHGWSVTSLLNIGASRFFLSILIVYLLMCALYESWVYPFVIMFSVPLAVFGGFLGLSLAHVGTLLTTDQPVQQLDVLTFLGFVMLVGLVVKNAILLVEQSLIFLREHRMSTQAAVREAVRVRVRPVLMTSLTSIVGLFPLALMPGAGSELYRGLASVLLGGMLVSTVGTLFLVPTVMCVMVELRGLFAAESRPSSDPSNGHAPPADEVLGPAVARRG